MYNKRFSTRVFTNEEDDLLNVLNRYGFMSFNQADIYSRNLAPAITINKLKL